MLPTTGWLYKHQDLLLVIPPWAREADESADAQFQQNGEPPLRENVTMVLSSTRFRLDLPGCERRLVACLQHVWAGSRHQTLRYSCLVEAMCAWALSQ